MLAFCGFSVGKASIRHGKKDNARGYYENLDITQFNEKLLNRLGLRWDTLVSDPEFFRPHQAELYEHAKRLFQENYGETEKGVLKDPRLAVSLSFWRTVAQSCEQPPEIKHVFVNRHPRGVVQSLTRRGKKGPVPFQYGDQPAKAYLFWIFNTLSYLEQLQDQEYLTCDYDDQLTKESRAALFSRFAEFIHFELDEAQISAFETKFFDESHRAGIEERRSDEDYSIEERDAAAIYDAIKRGDRARDILATEPAQTYLRMGRLISQVMGQEAAAGLKLYNEIRPDYEKGLAVTRAAEMIFGRASIEDLAEVLTERRRFGG
jgi:hypothetical protein